MQRNIPSDCTLCTDPAVGSKSHLHSPPTKHTTFGDWSTAVLETIPPHLRKNYQPTDSQPRSTILLHQPTIARKQSPPIFINSDQHSNDYQTLVSRVSLQTAQLASLQSELKALSDEKSEKENLLRACAKGLENVWEKIEAQSLSQHQPSQFASAFSPGSLPSSATAFSSSRIHALLTALQAGRLTSSHEINNIFTTVSTELDALLQKATASLAECKAHAQNISKESWIEHQNAVHRLSTSLNTKHLQKQQLQVLHQWRLSAIQSKSDSKLHTALERLGESKIAQTRAQTLSGIFHFWKSLTKRQRNVKLLESATIKANKLKLLRTAYFSWRVQLLQRTQKQLTDLKTKLTESWSADQIDQGTRTQYLLQLKYLQLKIWSLWVQRLKRSEVVIKKRHHLLIFRSWFKLAAARVYRATVLGNAFKQAIERKKYLAIRKWRELCINFHQQRLHTFAALTEGIKFRVAKQDIERKAKGWIKWQMFVLWKRQKAKEDDTEKIREEVRGEIQTAKKMWEKEQRKKQAEWKDQTELEVEAKVTEAEARSKEVITKLKRELDALNKNQDAMMAEVQQRSRQDLADLEASWTKERARLKEQVEELQLTQKHVILEMKHQEHVYEGLKQDVKDKSHTSAIKESVSGVNGYLGQSPNPTGGSTTPQQFMPTVFYPGASGPIMPGSHVDPYLNSPVYHHHIQKEFLERHRSELAAAQAAEKQQAQFCCDLRLQLEKMKALYQAEHKALKALQQSHQSAAAQRSHSKESVSVQVLQEKQELREEGMKKDHKLDLVHIELRALQAKHEDLIATSQQRQEDDAIRFDKLQTQFNDLIKRNESMKEGYLANEKKMEQDHLARIEELREAHAKELQEFHTAQDALLQRLEAKHQDVVASLKLDQEHLDGKHGDAVTNLRADHAAHLSQLESSYKDKCAELASSHQRDLSALDEKHQKEVQQLVDIIERGKKELQDAQTTSVNTINQLQARISVLESSMKEANELQAESDKAHEMLLERNRKLAAALVEDQTDKEDHTHVGLNEASILAAKLSTKQVLNHMNNPAVRPRSSSGFKPLKSSRNQHTHVPPAAPSSNGSTSSTSSELVQLQLQQRDQQQQQQLGLLGFGSIPISSTRLSLTPITQLAFSPPVTPPIVGSDEPWPKPTPIANEEPDGHGQQPDQQQFEQFDQFRDVEPQQQQPRDWYRSPTSNSFTITSPTSAPRTSRTMYERSSSQANGTTRGGWPSSTMSATVTSNPGYARPIQAQPYPSPSSTTVGGGSASRLKTNLLTSPRNQLDVASLFQHGLNQI